MTELHYCHCGDHVKATSEGGDVYEIHCLGCDISLIGDLDKITAVWNAWADSSKEEWLRKRIEAKKRKYAELEDAALDVISIMEPKLDSMYVIQVWSRLRDLVVRKKR